MQVNQEQCNKLANLLESFADKLRNPSMGTLIWLNNVSDFDSLIVILQNIFKSKISRSLEEDWPEYISD